FSLRERLDKANGNHDNLVLWRFPTPLLAPPAFTLQSFLTMDKWLANIEADTSDTPIEQKVVRNKPADAVDFCCLSGDTTCSNKITDQRCDQDPRLRAYSSPRHVAGGPLSVNILKCQLEPFNPCADTVTFTPDQLTRLQQVFSTGVCDWSKPGVNQQPANWPLTFEGGPGGVPLGPAPTSASL